MSFKKWFETQTLGGGIEPPKQDPTDLGQQANADYHAPGSDELPPVNGKMKAGGCGCKPKSKKMCKCKMKKK